MTWLWPILTSPNLSNQRLSMQFSHLLEVCSSLGFQGTVASCFSSCFTGHCLSTSFTGHHPVRPPISPPSKLRSDPGLGPFLDPHSLHGSSHGFQYPRLLNLFCHPDFFLQLQMHTSNYDLNISIWRFAGHLRRL